MSFNQRKKAQEAFKILNDIVADLLAGTNSFRFLNPPNLKDQSKLILRKMFLSHLCLAMYKYLEFYERYKDVIPSSRKEQCLLLYKNIDKRKIRDFRNNTVGHIWDDKEKRPLTNKEVSDYLELIFEGNESDFLNWINNPHGNVYPRTVVSVCESVRNDLVSENNFSDKDLNLT